MHGDDETEVYRVLCGAVEEVLGDWGVEASGGVYGADGEHTRPRVSSPVPRRGDFQRAAFPVIVLSCCPPADARWQAKKASR